MKPDFRIVADGSDVSGKIAKNLAMLRLTDKAGMEADQVEIELTDTTGAMALPRRGASLSVALGWQDEGMVFKGTFKVDEVGESGPPDVISIVARSADFRSTLKDQREASYNRTTLGAVLETIAARNGLTAAIHRELAAKPITHLDQTSESDANLITRLGDDYGAVATVKAGRLLFVPAGTGMTASGAMLPTVTISRGAGDRHTFRATDRDGTQTGVQAKWHDFNSGKTFFALAGEEGSVKTLKRTYPNQKAAQEAADAEWKLCKSQAHELTMSLAKGRPDLLACSPAKLSGWRREITAISWVLGDVVHEVMGDGGYTTGITATEIFAK